MILSVRLQALLSHELLGNCKEAAVRHTLGSQRHAFVGERHCHVAKAGSQCGLGYGASIWVRRAAAIGMGCGGR